MAVAGAAVIRKPDAVKRDINKAFVILMTGEKATDKLKQDLKAMCG